MRRGISGRILVLAAATLLVAGSFCAFDAGEGTGLDLCSVMLLPVTGPSLRAPQPLAGNLNPVPVPFHPGVPLDRPVPPPKV